MNYGFQLPKYGELTKEQLQIASLDITKNWVIKGAPGTGKTVMAVYLAEKMKVAGRKVLILVFNKPLKLFIESPNQNSFEINTYHSWIKDLYKKYLQKDNYPYSGHNKFNVNWGQVVCDFSNYNGWIYDDIIFDEAQDIPLELIKFVKKISKNVIAFIDPNQALQPNKVSIDQLLEELDVAVPYILTKNYRNTKEISQVAKLFWTNKENDNYIEGFKKGKKPIIINIENSEYSSLYNEQNEKIAKIIENNREKTIAIVTNYNSVGSIADEMKKRIGKDVIEEYNTKKKLLKVSFDKNTIKVFSQNTVKGLEFDIVIVARCTYLKALNNENDNNLLYVICTRARDLLYFCYPKCDKSMNNQTYIKVNEKINNNKNLFSEE